jgi:hypothetical protein
MRFIKYLFIFLCCSLIGFTIHPYFLEFAISQMSDVSKSFAVYSLGSGLIERVAFAIGLGVLPMLGLSVIRYCKIIVIYKKLIVFLVITVTGIISCELRISYIKMQVLYYRDSTADINVIYEWTGTLITYFFLGGLVVGTLLCLVIFKPKNRPVTDDFD